MINVTSSPYNATGDGVTDDTAAIQAAISASPTGVYFPPGTYLVSATLTISTSKLQGEHFWRSNQGGSIIKAAAAFTGTAVIKCANNASQISDLAIDAQSVDYGLHCYKMHGASAYVNNVSVFNSAVACFYFEQCQTLFTQRLHAEDSDGVGILAEAANATVFSHCRAHRNAGNGFTINRGASSGGCRLHNCVSEGNTGHGIEFAGTSNINGNHLTMARVRDCWLEQNDGDGIVLTNVVAAIISGNRISGGTVAADRGIRLDNCNICTIRDNFIAQTGIADYLEIRNISGESNVFENNWQLSEIVKNPLTVSLLGPN